MFSLTSCETDVEDPTAVVPPAPYVGDSGSADFSSYVSLGASNASGFMDNSLFIAGQLNSFPNILVKNFVFRACAEEILRASRALLENQLRVARAQDFLRASPL